LGCDLNDPASLEAFLQAKELRETNVQKARERKGMHQPMRTRSGKQTPVATDGHRLMQWSSTSWKERPTICVAKVEIEEAQAHAAFNKLLPWGISLD
jgi:hypothetical protein